MWKKEFFSSVYCLLVIIDVSPHLLEPFICNGMLQSFTGILWNTLWYQIMPIVNQCLMLSWGALTWKFARGYWAPASVRFLRVLWHPSWESSRSRRALQGCWMGRDKRAETVWDRHCPSTVPVGGAGMLRADRGLGAGWWWWLLCSVNGCFMLISLRWLFLIPDSNMRVLEQRMSQMWKKPQSDGLKGCFEKSLEGKPHRLESCPAKTQLGGKKPETSPE